jgi:hypothetical protein
MQNENILQSRAVRLIQAARQLLGDPAFCHRHCQLPKHFTRKRTFQFPVVMMMILQKSLKSLQLRIHEFVTQWTSLVQPLADGSAGAFTHARAKLLPGAFVELNQKAVLAIVYGPEADAAVLRWRGHRLLGIDSSMVRLPSSPQLFQAFGQVQCANQHGAQDCYPEGRISVLYDLLNQVGLEGHLVGSAQAETELARRHWPLIEAQDVVITDRGYSGYCWFAERSRQGNFISRCSRGSFAIVQTLFARNEAGVSLTVELSAPSDQRAELKRLKLPLKLKVRFITLRLSTGELEVLATSLLDEVAYPTESFTHVYWLRWGIETFYGRIKGRLDLEHFSGETVCAVQQDFQATLFVSNVETIISAPVQAEMPQPTPEREQALQVNRAVSLHAIKYQLIELLASAVPVEEVLARLQQWMGHNPVAVRPERGVPRRKPSAFRSYHYQRRVRKIVY